MKANKFGLIGIFIVLLTSTLWGGNPDRQGEAGAYELLLNPWARSAGIHTLTTSMITGVESMRLNVAGLVHIPQTQVLIGHTRYLVGTGINLNAIGVGQRVSKNGVFGLSLMAMDFGDIAVTTTDQPEGTGATFSPNFFHLGLSYAHLFDNKVSVGFTLRTISETTADLSAQGFAIDAGVQYVTGAQDNFKFGISLRNVGTPMRFGGEGLSFRARNPDGTINYDLSYDQRSATFELPSVLNIGASYDINIDTRNRLSLVGNFTSNSFSRDAIGAGLEYSFNDILMLRGAYRYDLGSNQDVVVNNVYSGVAAGVSLEVPFSEKNDTRFAIDYGYRATSTWNGTHNLTLRFTL
ncbi:MAG: PorV/PorQ family protein [Saprospiraceae bacterium]|nr:PorV/PorQ family protein [Saprospiraceae bacterium]